MKISKYSEELLKDLDKLDGWPNKVKVMQSNWIGKSIGAEIDFEIVNDIKKIKVFTTRPDTIYGATFIALSVDHELSLQLSKQDGLIKSFIDECKTLNVEKDKKRI